VWPAWTRCWSASNRGRIVRGGPISQGHGLNPGVGDDNHRDAEPCEQAAQFGT
jgi:hypothetical protein